MRNLTINNTIKEYLRVSNTGHLLPLMHKHDPTTDTYVRTARLPLCLHGLVVWCPIA